MFVAAGSVVYECGRDLSSRRELPDLLPPGDPTAFEISKLQLLSPSLLFVGVLPSRTGAQALLRRCLVPLRQFCGMFVRYKCVSWQAPRAVCLAISTFVLGR
eukprot:COSAG01_NODE_12078_length_1804_cov_1.690323_2_plen_102_part_00